MLAISIVLSVPKDSVIKASLIVALANEDVEKGEYPDQMEDFDVAFAYEALARSFALAGDHEEYQKNYHLAKEAGESIKDKGDHKVFQNDLQSGDWFGCK